MTYILQDRPCSVFEFLPGRALLAKRVAQLIILEYEPVGVKTSLTALFLSNSFREETWALRFDAAHDLELSSSPGPLVAEDNQLLTSTFASTFVLPLVHEEHQ